MSANPYWEITLARSSDMQEIGPLAYAFSLSPAFNRPGSLSMTLPLDSEIAYKVAKYSTCVICERNDEIVWSGSVITVNRDPQAMTLSLTAIGWLDELSHRFVRVEEEAALIFLDTTGGNIVQALVNTVNAQTDSSGTVRPTHLTFALSMDSQQRTRSYKRGQNYGQAIQELSDVENGLDIRVDPRSRTITTSAPESFQDRVSVAFGYGVEPFNLANALQTDDGSNGANRISAVGSNGIIVPADDPGVITAQGFMREDWLSLSDVADTNIIGAYANEEMIYRRYGQISYDIKPLPYEDGPRLWDDFNLGDQVYLSVDAGALKLDGQAVRVFSVGIEVDAQGNETISQITTSPSS
jgi:hypothetical protein